MLSISVMGAHADHDRLELFGSDGAIIGDGELRATNYLAGAAADDGIRPLAVNDREPADPQHLPSGLAGHAACAMALMLQDWLPAFNGGQSEAATFDDGLLSLAVIDGAAQRSAQGGGLERVHATA
jgi:predicted dehydrogenase